MSSTYQTIRSNRRTIGLQIKAGQVIVRAPAAISDAQIRDFVARHQDWIDKHLAQSKARQEQNTAPRLSVEEIDALAEQAMRVIPERVRYYAPKVGVTYGTITIRNQRTRWGSCSSKGNLNFNCLLMLTPPEVIDSIVVHELCHRKELNHSQRFYDEVLRVFPDYWKWNGWLKEHGGGLMRRMTG